MLIPQNLQPCAYMSKMIIHRVHEKKIRIERLMACIFSRDSAWYLHHEVRGHLCDRLKSKKKMLDIS